MPTALLISGRQIGSAWRWYASDNNGAKLLPLILERPDSCNRDVEHPQMLRPAATNIAHLKRQLPYMIGSPRTISPSTAVPSQQSSDLQTLCYLCILLCTPVMGMPYRGSYVDLAVVAPTLRTATGSPEQRDVL
jgi:hypothetical protein